MAQHPHAHAPCWAEDCALPSTSACGRCRTAEYCGAPCQRSHWPAHKLRCKELEAAADAAEAAAEAAAAVAPAAGGGGAGAAPAAPRAPGVYSGMDCRVQDYHCALAGCGAALQAGGASTVCPGCRAVVYCNEECQGVHWVAHMKGCYLAVFQRVWGGDVHQVVEGGEHVLRAMLSVLREKHGDRDARTLRCTGTLGRFLMLQGNLAEAGTLLRECLLAARAALGPRHEVTHECTNYLAELQYKQGNLAEAALLQREVLETQRATWGPLHARTLDVMSTLASTLREQGKYDEAEALYREALEGKTATLGPQHLDTVALKGSLAILLHDQGRLDEAEPLLRSDLEATRADLGSAPTHSCLCWKPGDGASENGQAG